MSSTPPPLPLSQAEMRKLMIELVLATDVTTHIPFMKRFNEDVAAQTVTPMQAMEPMHTMHTIRGSCGRLPLQGCINQRTFTTATQAMAAMLKGADVSNPTRPLAVYAMWVEGIMTEFFAQGDAERTPANVTGRRPGSSWQLLVSAIAPPGGSGRLDTARGRGPATGHPASRLPRVLEPVAPNQRTSPILLLLTTPGTLGLPLSMNCDRESGSMLILPFPGSQQPVRPPTHSLHHRAPSSHPLAGWHALGLRGAPSPRGCRGEAGGGAPVPRLESPMSLRLATRSVNVNKCQVGFINFIVSPIWKGLAQLLPAVGPQLISELEINLAHYQALAA